MDRLSGTGLAIDLPQEIVEVRVHLRFPFLAPVAHEPVELLQAVRVVAAVALEGDGDVLAGMRVMEGEGAGVALRDGVLQFAGRTDEE